jgi:hypothetical protein
MLMVDGKQRRFSDLPGLKMRGSEYVQGLESETGLLFISVSGTKGE